MAGVPSAKVKRQIRAVGAFPNRASALRLITAVALRATETWASRRYPDVSMLDRCKEHVPKVA